MRTLFLVPFLGLFASLLAAQSPGRDTTRKVFVVPGERHGPSVFPLVDYPEVRPLAEGQLDWKHYHSSTEIEMWMKRRS